MNQTPHPIPPTQHPPIVPQQQNESKPHPVIELDFLVPRRFAAYDLSRPPGYRNLGSGVGVKYARVEEAGGKQYHCRRTFDISEIKSDIIFADWLWFCLDADRVEQIKSFLACEASIKIIYGSELCMLNFPLNELNRLLDPDENIIITHNTAYQRKLYKCRNIYDSRHLCDPIPGHCFFPEAPKQRRLVCMGQINEAKRSDLVLQIFQELKGEVETMYIGGNLVWGKNKNRTDAELHLEIQETADIFIENATQAEVAEKVNESAFFAHVAAMDCSSTCQQENATAGNITFALTHPTMKERTPYCFDNVDGLINAIKEYPELGSEKHRDDMNAALETSQMWTYEAWRSQIANILRIVL